MTRGESKNVSPRRLHELYIKQGLYGREVAEMVGIPERTFWELIDRYQLKRSQKPSDRKFCKTCGHLIH